MIALTKTSQVSALWEVMAKVPGTAPQSTIEVDNFVWLAEALTSDNPDCVPRPVKLPKITRAGRFKSLAKSIAPMRGLLSKKTASPAFPPSMTGTVQPTTMGSDAIDHRLSIDYIRATTPGTGKSSGNQTATSESGPKRVGLPPIARG